MCEKQRKKSKSATFVNTDHFYKKLWSTMVLDFRATLGPSFCLKEELALRKGVKTFRQLNWGSRMLAPYYYFKAEYQLEALFKRYRFRDDFYSDEELQEITTSKFFATQQRLAEHDLGEYPYRAKLVVQRARRIIHEILGSYDVEEHYRSCEFGKRASVGVPYKESYLDSKLGLPHTGSCEHIVWFIQALKSDTLLEGAITSCVPFEYPRYELCDALPMVNVPKSWKSLRSILPNTTLGGFYTSGLAKMIEKRLRHVGLNISTLQDIHRSLVPKYSRTRSHVTADLSAASDSFTSRLVNMLLPRDWYNALKKGRISHVEARGVNSSLMMSFCTMGIGFTFPFQTLCFYALLRALKQLSKAEGRISVYGDDLIYPVSMHTYVESVFSDLGFILNGDKTYVKESFRESCGEDAYCGFCVRPFSPKGEYRQLGRRSYLPVLYKTYNGLRERWGEEELPITFRWLLTEITRCANTVFQVPTHYPDYSGIRVEKPRMEWYIPWAKPKYTKHGSFTIPCIAYIRNLRPVKWQVPYYWNQLRSAGDEPAEIGFTVDTVDEPILLWERVKTRPWRTSSGERLRYYLRPLTSIKGLEGKVTFHQAHDFAWS